jgi:predicted RNA polymerase sigma factor
VQKKDKMHCTDHYMSFLGDFAARLEHLREKEEEYKIAMDLKRELIIK